MAITKSFLDGSPSAVAAFLTDTGLFGYVVQNSNVITCNDSNNVTLLTITKTGDYAWSLSVNVDGTHSYTKEYTTTGLNWGYSCTNGAMLVFNYNSQYNTYSVLLSKTNNNKIAVAIPTEYGSNTLYCIAYSDAYPVNSYYISQSVSEQTVLSPLITNAAAGSSSYTPNAFYIPFGEYVGRGYAKFIMNGITYLTDGFFAISDEEPTTNNS